MLFCIRTTLNLDDGLMRDVKALAARTGRTLTDVITDALRETLARSRATARGERPPLPTFGTGGLQPGVDLDDTAALLDLMERGRDPA